MAPAPQCRCGKSLAVICALFASIAVAAFLAEDRCLDAGGRVRDGGWVCELSSGAVSSLWDLVSVPAVALVFVIVGLPVYFLVRSIKSRPNGK